MARCKCHIKTWAADISDFHGLKHVAGATGKGYVRRGLWLLCFMASSGYFVYLLYLSVTDYQSWPHSTSVDVLYSDSIDFPAVTICNFNKYRESLITAEDIVNVGPSLGITNEDFELLDEHLYSTEFVERVESYTWSDYSVDPDYNMTEFQFRTGHQLEEMIVWCTYAGEECDADHFDHVFSHGNCFTFNKLKDNVALYKSKKSGASNGLKLLLDVDEIEYTPTNDLGGDAEDAGFKLMIHENNEPPYVQELGFAVGAGQHTYIGMRKEHIASLGGVYTSCVGDDDFTLKYYDHFTLQGCRIECETEVVEKECGCRLVEQPSDGFYEVCSPQNMSSCAYPKLAEYVEGTLETQDDYVCDHCRSPCEAFAFPMSLSNSKLRSDYLEAHLSNHSTHNKTADYIEKNFVAVTIYYEGLNYELIEMEPKYSPFILMTIIGGNLGLWLGGSLMTFVQLFEYLIDEFIVTKLLDKVDEEEEEDKRTLAEANGLPVTVVSSNFPSINGHNKVQPTPVS